MKSDQKSRRQLKKEFEQARAQYAKLQTRWEKDRAKVLKRAQKLKKLEFEIAELERRLHSLHKDADDTLVRANADDAGRHARLIFKPTEDNFQTGKEQLREIESRLRAHGISPASVWKSSGKVVRAVAKEAVKNKEPLILVAAGDGTIEDVALQLIGSQTTLGVIPTGTMNNLARAWGIPLLLEDACALLAMGLTREIDVGAVDCEDGSEVEYFLESAGVGLSAIALPAGQAAEKHDWNMLPKALRKLFDAEPAYLVVELDDGKVIGAKSHVVTVSNAPLLGNNILIAPKAKMDDGHLDVAIYEGMGKTDLVGYCAAASNGKPADDPRVSFYRAKRVRIRTDRPEDTSADKEVIEKAQLMDISVLPKALRVIVGKGIGLTFPVEHVPSEPPLSGAQKQNEVTADESNAGGAPQSTQAGSVEPIT